MKEFYNKRIVTAKAQGTYHQMINKPCQDAVAYYQNDNSLITILCDGAGSIEYSEYISDFCTKEICNDFEIDPSFYFSATNDQLINKISSLTKQICCNEIDDINLAADCTLLLYAEYKEQNMIIHVGDGIILGVNENETVCLSKPENGMYINETYFLSSKNLSTHAKIIRDIPNIYDTIIMTSDGLQGIIFDLVKNKGVEATQIIRSWIKQDFLNTELMLNNAIHEVLSQETDDDISIAIINR